MSTTPGERPGGPAAPQETVAASCPFCGAKGAKIVPAGHIDWTVECGQCGARGPRNNAGAWALVRWNTAALRTALEQAQQDSARLGVILDEAALEKAVTAADDEQVCSCADDFGTCFYRLSLGERVRVCIRAAVAAYLSAIDAARSAGKAG